MDNQYIKLLKILIKMDRRTVDIFNMLRMKLIFKWKNNKANTQRIKKCSWLKYDQICYEDL